MIGGEDWSPDGRSPATDMRQAPFEISQTRSDSLSLPRIQSVRRPVCRLVPWPGYEPFPYRRVGNGRRSGRASRMTGASSVLKVGPGQFVAQDCTMARGAPPIHDIATFVAVAEHASFTRAAEQLGTSKSNVGKAVQRLEAQLGTRLLPR